MGESFFGLNIALRGLQVAQRNLDIINHNISNTNTSGYSRQRVVQTAARPMSMYDGTGMIGTGADVISVERIRDEYLDYKYWSESTTYGEWETKASLLADMEAIFNEPSDNGFNTIIDSFFNSLQELAKDPSSGATRALVRENGITVAKYFNNIATRFEQLQQDINLRINAKVTEINSLALQISQMNKQIYSAELDGNVANDLRDQRTVLVDKLSKIVNIDAGEEVVGILPDGKEDKHFVVTISGKAIVDHYELSKLEPVQRDVKLNPNEDIFGLYDVKWEDGNSLTVKSGELKAYLDLRDGNASENNSPAYNGIPFYIRKLNQFVRTFAMAFNEGYIDGNTNGIIDVTEDGLGHADGYGIDIDGVGPLMPKQGIRFFTITDDKGNVLDSNTFINGETTISAIAAQYENMTAKNFSISREVIASTDNIAPSDKPGESGNIVNLNAILLMRNNAHMFSEGAPEDYMKSIVTTLGIDSQQAKRIYANQDVIINQIQNRRLSDSGVSLDEEMANLVKQQNAYIAAAKMISTMTEIYDTLVNKIGV